MDAIQADIYVCYQWRSPISPTVPEGSLKMNTIILKYNCWGTNQGTKKYKVARQSCTNRDRCLTFYIFQTLYLFIVNY